MNDLIKNILGVALSLGVLAIGYNSFQFIDNYGKSIEPSSFRSFWVTGESKGVAVPDIAEFTFSVITEGDSADIADLQKENTEKMNKSISFVKSQGIETKDISTQHYQIDPRYNYTPCELSSKPCPPPEIVGYTVSQAVSVKIRDFSKISPILTGVVEAGANSVSQLNFTLDDPTEVQNEVRAKAIEKAKAKAENLAKAAGFKLGRLLEIQEGFVSSPFLRTNYAEPAMMARDAEAGAMVPAIEPGVQEVELSIQLKYEIE